MADMKCGMIRQSLLSGNERKEPEEKKAEEIRAQQCMNDMGNMPCAGDHRKETGFMAPYMGDRQKETGFMAPCTGDRRQNMGNRSMYAEDQNRSMGTRTAHMGNRRQTMGNMPMRTEDQRRMANEMPGMEEGQNTGNMQIYMGNRQGMSGMQPCVLNGTQNLSSGQARCMLRKQIDEFSFAMDDAHLFLDTHPDNAGAFRYFKDAVSMRQNAVSAYERQFGPLMVEDAVGSTWDWVTEKWPWEGGC